MSIDVASPLRQRMIEDMTARKLSAGTQRLPSAAASGLPFLQRSPDTAAVEGIRRFQLHLAETGTSIPNRNRIMTGLRLKSMNSRTAAKSDFGLEKASLISTSQAKPGWGVQLIGSPSQASALASFQQLQRTYKLLETRQPFVIQSKVGTSGFWYRVRVATDSRGEAEKLCSNLRAAGGSCLVQRN